MSYMAPVTVNYLVRSEHGVQRRMISVDNFFVFLRLLFLHPVLFMV